MSGGLFHPLNMETMNYTTNSYPIITAPGKVLHATLGNEPVVLVGTHPDGYTAELSPDGWEKLTQWNATELVATKGRVRVRSGGRLGPYASNIITDNDPARKRVVFHRNGKFLDLRTSNLIAVPRTLAKAAEHSRHAKPTQKSPTVTLRDGRTRSRRKPPIPAHERLEAMLNG